MWGALLLRILQSRGAVACSAEFGSLEYYPLLAQACPPGLGDGDKTQNKVVGTATCPLGFAKVLHCQPAPLRAAPAFAWRPRPTRVRRALLARVPAWCRAGRWDTASARPSERGSHGREHQLHVPVLLAGAAARRALQCPVLQDRFTFAGSRTAPPGRSAGLRTRTCLRSGRKGRRATALFGARRATTTCWPPKA